MEKPASQSAKAQLLESYERGVEKVADVLVAAAWDKIGTKALEERLRGYAEAQEKAALAADFEAIFGAEEA